MTERDSEIAVLGGGCFWCLEAVFTQLDGVVSVVSGYSGGATDNPSYRAVCGGNTGHAEVVRISFDPSRISFPTLLEVFFAIHDPTTLNRQGHDVGTQYRSIIFYQSPPQKKIAEKAISGMNAANAWGAPVLTEVVPAQKFHPAEDSHQRYFERNPDQAYCQVVIAPKVAKLRRYFQQLIGTGERN